MKRKNVTKLFFTLLFTFLILNCGNDNFYNDNCSIDNEKTNQEDTKMIQPITEYQNYFYTEHGKIYGIDEQGVKIIEVLDSEDVPANVKNFFKKDSNLFFTVETVDNSDPENPVVNTDYFNQCGGEVTSITSLPTKPVLSRSQLSNQDFTIENFDYNGSLMSDVRNINMESGIERFYMVDGFSYIPNVGLYFNVSDGRYTDDRMVRDKGLYFWPLDRSSINQVLVSGEMW